MIIEIDKEIFNYCHLSFSPTETNSHGNENYKLFSARSPAGWDATGHSSNSGEAYLFFIDVYLLKS